MTNEKENLWVRVLVAAPYLLVLYILQAMVFPRLPLLGVKPLLLPTAVVGVAVFDGALAGGAFGLAAGMLTDLSMNQPTIVFTLALTFLGLAAGYLAETVLARGLPAYVLLTAAALAVCVFIQIARFIFIEAVPPRALAETALTQTAVSFLLALPLYWVNRAITKIM